jgi:putative nucleotidyltransferase with HDIG domain
MNDVLDILREATGNSEYENRLFLVGGIVRDKVLGLPGKEDIDIVYEGNALELAHFLKEAGITDHPPVLFPRFGTAMVSVKGKQIELVSARSESYEPTSRKPVVELASLEQDVLRRDFTINTLLENLHTGKRLDLTGEALKDIKEGIIRTPTDPYVTFEDDPLRMLRAVRFSARFDFRIEEQTYQALVDRAERLEIISKERIRDEFNKMLMGPRNTQALELLRKTGLLSHFAPELVEMYGVTQNVYHLYDVWTHTMRALENLPEGADLVMRLAALFHDVGKPKTRTVDEKGQVHFYTHQMVGSDITKRILSRLRYSNEEIHKVSWIVCMHLRVGEYDEDWTDAAVRRLIRDAGDDLDKLITLTEVDKGAANTTMPSVDLSKLMNHIQRVQSETRVHELTSPLNGREIMETLHMEAGPEIRKIKDFLTNEVIEGRLHPGDKEQAKELLAHYKTQKSEG